MTSSERRCDPPAGITATLSPFRGARVVSTFPFCKRYIVSFARAAVDATKVSAVDVAWFLFGFYLAVVHTNNVNIVQRIVTLFSYLGILRKCTCLDVSVAAFGQLVQFSEEPFMG